MPRYVMAVDTRRCTNCKACIVACQQRNELPYGHFRNWVRSTPDPGSPSGFIFQPGGCMQCAEPPCVEACPTLATHKDPDGVVRVDRDRCIGCGSCIAACPYGARSRDPEFGVADKCDYCTASLTRGLAPACVLVCATRARIFGDADDPQDPVNAALRQQPLTYVQPPGKSPKPTLAYLDPTRPTDWPHSAGAPGPVTLMRPVATAVRWLGGLSLFGVLAVCLRQFLTPEDPERHGDAPVGPQTGRKPA